MAVTVTPFLWYHAKAQEAATFYCELIPDSRIESVTGMATDSPGGSEGSVQIVQFILAGRPFTAMGCAGPDIFNHAISLSIGCDTQAEIDRLWDGLLEGGAPMECGWLTDRYGLKWQIVPNKIHDWIGGPDQAGKARATQAMMQMVKFDMARLQAAYEGADA